MKTFLKISGTLSIIFGADLAWWMLAPLDMQWQSDEQLGLCFFAFLASFAATLYCSLLNEQ